MKTISSSTKHNVSINMPVPWISMGFYWVFFQPCFFFGGGRKQLKHQWGCFFLYIFRVQIPMATQNLHHQQARMKHPQVLKGHGPSFVVFGFWIPQPWYVFFWKFGLWISNHSISIFLGCRSRTPTQGFLMLIAFWCKETSKIHWTLQWRGLKKYIHIYVYIYIAGVYWSK